VRSWLTARQLLPYASELNPAGAAWLNWNDRWPTSPTGRPGAGGGAAQPVPPEEPVPSEEVV
jgi:hypothetical protein